MKTTLALVSATFIILPTFSYAADAKANWQANCVQCHGQSGNADTKMGKILNAKDLTDSKVQAAFTDAKAMESIKNGVKQNGKTTMKAFGGKLSDDEIKALVAYVRSLKK
jgi:mono/diheme cytochrome c family protein